MSFSLNIYLTLHVHVDTVHIYILVYKEKKRLRTSKIKTNEKKIKGVSQVYYLSTKTK